MSTTPPGKSSVFVGATLCAIALPPLWLGGVPYGAQLAFALTVAAAAVWRASGRTGRSWRNLDPRSNRSWRLPRRGIVLVLLVAWTAAGALPMPPSILRGLAPEYAALRDTLFPGRAAETWSSLGLLPGQTLLEAARLLALGVLFVLCAQLRRRTVLTAIVASGTSVALIGLVTFYLGVDEIGGVYTPSDRPSKVLRPIPSISGTFVNGNHLASLLLLSIGAAAFTLLDRRRSSALASQRGVAHLQPDALYLLALLICGYALLLTHSRAAFGGALIIMTALAFAFLRHRGWRGMLAAMSIVALCGLGGAALLPGAQWEVLMSEFAELQSVERDVKLSILQQNWELRRLSPIIGIGRGSATELLPMRTDVAPGMTITHIESIPVLLVVEYGVVMTFFIAVMLGMWIVRVVRHLDLTTSVLLATFVAVALQNCVDFSLDFIGAAAPMTALAATLTPTRKIRVPTSRATRFTSSAVASLLLLLGASWSAGGGWATARTIPARVQAGEIPLDRALGWRPLDPRLWILRARQQLEKGDLSGGRASVALALTLEPNAVESHLLKASILAAQGAKLASERAVRTALANIASPPSPSLISHLVTSLPPDALGRAAPRTRLPFMLLAPQILEQSPKHALALARPRAFASPPDPEAVALRVRAAMAIEDDLLARVEARHLTRLQPDENRSYLLFAQANRVREEPARERETQATLRAALQRESLRSPRYVHLLLVESLAVSRDVPALRQALTNYETAPRKPQDLTGRGFRQWRSNVLQRAKEAIRTAPGAAPEDPR